MGAAFFFMGLVTHDELTDDYGRGREDYHRMHRLLFAGRPEITQEIVRGWFDELAAALDGRGVGLVRRYIDTEGLDLFELPSFVRRQPMKYRRKSILDEYVVPETPQTAPSCDKLPQLAETCGNLRNIGDGIDVPIDTPTVPPGAPEGQRAEADTATDNDLKPFGARSRPDAAETAAPIGRGSDAPEENSMDGDGSFERADDPAEASRLWKYVENEFRLWNGYAPEEKRKATAIARGMMDAHEGRVKVLASVFDTARDTDNSPEKRWATFGKKLKGRGGGSKDAKRWAKGITG